MSTEISLPPSDEGFRIRFQDGGKEFIVAKGKASITKPDGSVVQVGKETSRLRLDADSIYHVAAKVLEQNSSFWEKLLARFNPFTKHISVQVQNKETEQWLPGTLVVSRGSVVKRLRLGRIALFPEIPFKKIYGVALKQKIMEAAKEAFKQDLLPKLKQAGNRYVTPGTGEGREAGSQPRDEGITQDILNEVIDVAWSQNIQSGQEHILTVDDTSFILKRDDDGRLHILYSLKDVDRIDLTTGKGGSAKEPVPPPSVGAERGMSSSLDEGGSVPSSVRDGKPTVKDSTAQRRAPMWRAPKEPSLEDKFANKIGYVSIDQIPELAALKEEGIIAVCLEYVMEQGRPGNQLTGNLRLGLPGVSVSQEAAHQLAIKLGGIEKRGQSGNYYIEIETKKAQALASLRPEERIAAMAANLEAARKAGAPLEFQRLIRENKASEALAYYKGNPDLPLKSASGSVQARFCDGPAAQNYVSSLKSKILDEALTEETRNQFRQLLLILIDNDVDLPMGFHWQKAKDAGETHYVEGREGVNSKFILTPKFYKDELLGHIQAHPKAEARLKRIFDLILKDLYHDKV